MLKKLVFSNYSDRDLPQDQWDRIKDICENMCLVSPGNTAKELHDAEGLFLKLGATADRELIEAAPNLRVIGMLGTGYGRIDIDFARSKDISVFNVADYATDAVAEFLLGTLINHQRELPRALANIQQGDYTESNFTGTQLRNKTLGIIGLGDIGMRVADIATNGFSMNVLYWSKNRKIESETDRIRFAEIDDLLSESDFVSLHLALTPETEGFLSSERLKLLRQDALLINTAPMELIDLQAVEKLIKMNKISLILDHPDEMLPEDVQRLNRFDKCIIYPPIGYTTVEATNKKQSIFVDNIVAIAKNSVPPNQVN